MYTYSPPIPFMCKHHKIHVPINIPAFAVSSDVDVEINAELVAHGYSNGIVGLFGGLQNYMAVSFTIFTLCYNFLNLDLTHTLWIFLFLSFSTLSRLYTTSLEVMDALRPSQWQD